MQMSPNLCITGKLIISKYWETYLILTSMWHFTFRETLAKLQGILSNSSMIFRIFQDGRLINYANNMKVRLYIKIWMVPLDSAPKKAPMCEISSRYFQLQGISSNSSMIFRIFQDGRLINYANNMKVRLYIKIWMVPLDSAPKKAPMCEISSRYFQI